MDDHDLPMLAIQPNPRPTLDSLAVELLIRIISYLDHPANFAVTCKRLFTVCHDDFVRAKYLLVRYGRSEVFYHALGSGKLITPRVLDILLTHGARLSRYILQVAMNWTAHSASKNRFQISGEWTRSLPFAVYSHLTRIALDRYPDYALVAPHQVDGMVFEQWLAQQLGERGFVVSAWMNATKVPYEKVEALFERYGFIPFHERDPNAKDLPVAIAVEPRLYRLAVNNGFTIDDEIRNYIFRALFRKPFGLTNLADTKRVADLVQRATDLIEASSSMFITRTVAAEICMEVRHNPKAFLALKILDERRLLLFKLSDIVTSLISLFKKTRSIRESEVEKIITALYKAYSDEPCVKDNPVVRAVAVQVCFFGTKLPSTTTPNKDLDWSTVLRSLRTKLEDLGVYPISKDDLMQLLLSPFTKSCLMAMKWAMQDMHLTQDEVYELFDEVMRGSVTLNCKGSLYNSMAKRYPGFKNALSEWVVKNYSTSVDNFVKAKGKRPATLCEDFEEFWSIAGCEEEEPENEDMSDGDEDEAQGQPFLPPVVVNADDGFFSSSSEDDSSDTDEEEDEGTPLEGAEDPTTLQATQTSVLNPNGYDLGLITQDTLSKNFQKDQHSFSLSSRGGRRGGRRRWLSDWTGGAYQPSPLNMRVPWLDHAKSISDWVINQYSPRDRITAVFFCHAVANDNTSTISKCKTMGVPVTLKHFKIMAKFGHSIRATFREAVTKQQFYDTEEDYLSPPCNTGSGVQQSDHWPRVKMEESEHGDGDGDTDMDSGHQEDHHRYQHRRKRLRRTTANYVEPDSSEFDFEDEYGSSVGSKGKSKQTPSEEVQKAKMTFELGLCRWIARLAELLKEEDRKFKLTKSETEAKRPGVYRHFKTEFHKELASLLRDLRATAQVERTMIDSVYAGYGGSGSGAGGGVSGGDDSDGEYVLKSGSRWSRKRARDPIGGASGKRGRRKVGV